MENKNTSFSLTKLLETIRKASKSTQKFEKRERHWMYRNE